MPLFGRGDDRRERSAADREAARLERERRRAQREGRPLPEEPREPSTSDEPPPQEPRCPTSRPADDDPAPRATTRATTRPDEPPARATRRRPQAARVQDDAPVHDDDDPERRRRAALDAVRRRTPADDEPEAVDLPPEPVPDPGPTPSRRGRIPAPEPEPVPGGPVREPVDPQSTQPLEPVGAIHARRTVSLPRPQTEELGHHTDSWDRPIGTVRVSRGDYQAQPGAPGMPPHRNLGVQKTRRRWVRRFVVLLLVLALAAVVVFAFMLYQPFHGKGYDAVVVRIPPGSSARRHRRPAVLQGRGRVGLLLRAARARGAATAASCAPARTR